MKLTSEATERLCFFRETIEIFRQSRFSPSQFHVVAKRQKVFLTIPVYELKVGKSLSGISGVQSSRRFANGYQKTSNTSSIPNDNPKAKPISFPCLTNSQALLEHTPSIAGQKKHVQWPIINFQSDFRWNFLTTNELFMQTTLWSLISTFIDNDAHTMFACELIWKSFCQFAFCKSLNFNQFFILFSVVAE
jgi:hypothetical protein